MGSITASILLRLIDNLFGTDLLYSIIEAISIPFAWIYSILIVDISTKLFVLLLVFIGGVLVTFTFLYFSLKNNSVQENFTPAFIKYTEDKFKVLYYRWDWIKGSDGKYRVSNIIPMCPACKCSIVYEHCPNCNESYSGDILDDAEVEALIHHNIDKNSS